MKNLLSFAFLTAIILIATFAYSVLNIKKRPITKDLIESCFDHLIINGGDYSTYLNNIECKFVFTNRTDSVIRLDKIKTSCSCANHKYDKKHVKPGENSSITLLYDGTQKMGLFSLGALVYFKELPNDPVKLTFIGRRINPITFSPAMIDFSQYSQREDLKSTMTLTNNTKHCIDISSITSNLGFINCQFDKKSIKPGCDLSIIVSPNRTAPFGKWEDQIQVNVKNNEIGKIIVPVYGVAINGFVTAVSSNIESGFLKKGKIGRLQANVYSINQQRFDITDFTTDNDSIAIQWNKEYSDKQDIVILVDTKNMDIGKFNSSIVLNYKSNYGSGNIEIVVGGYIE